MQSFWAWAMVVPTTASFGKRCTGNMARLAYAVLRALRQAGRAKARINALDWKRRK